MAKSKPSLSADVRKHLFETLALRFERNPQRHLGLDWSPILAKLTADPKKAWSINEMEATGGEPDVIAQDAATGEYLFCDCSAESPAGRRSLCYDDPALEARKQNKPAGSALGMAAAMGVEILTEEQYRLLQTLDEFDTKTSSWITTPASIRNLGGAVFCDRRYDTVFLYHNGAESYYAARGFRGLLRV